MAKTKYDPDTFPLRVEGMARDGLVEADMAKALGIAQSSLSNYKLRYPEFQAALDRGKAPVDVQVENALFKRACGYETEEKVITKMPDGSTRVEIRKKQVPPDTVACIFWLKNRKPKQWRDKQEVEHSGQVEQSVIILPSNGRMIKEIPDGSKKVKAIE